MMENNQTKYQVVLVLLAAGSSSRMGTSTKKEYISLRNGTVLSKSAVSFLKSCNLDAVCITHPKDHETQIKEALFSDREFTDLIKDTPLLFTQGGDTRQSSVFNALTFISNQTFINKDNCIVLIHDGARPFVTEKVILDTLNATIKYGAAAPVIPPVDTQKEISCDGTIKRHLIRSDIGAIQTPQGFLLKPLLTCHTKASSMHKEFTDDTEIWDTFYSEADNKKVHIVSGDKKNRKITYAQDLGFMNKKTIYHTGIGTDLHILAEGRHLILGGVELDFARGEVGHSDGDALLHAITDALLGAAGLGDIGSYFPPEDNKWKDADSADLLKKCWSDVKEKGWSLCNLDAVIEIEKPKFIPYRKKVIKSIASILQVEEDQVFVKAKTNEGLGEVGKSNAVKTYCTCLLQKEIS